MSQDIKLKRLCQKGSTAVLIRRMVEDWNEPLCILDANGTSVFGEPGGDSEPCPITLEGQSAPLGWALGGRHAEDLAILVSFAAQKELEGKLLAQETLGKYKELTLLYDLGEKIAACLDVPELAQLVLDEAGRLLPGGQALHIAMLLSDEGEAGDIALTVQAGRGGLFPEGLRLAPLDGITRRVLASGTAEIVNDVAEDASYQAEPGCLPDLRALLCAPLKTNDRTYGALAVASRSPTAFLAAELKVLNLLASQAAQALGRAQMIKARVEQELLQESLKLSRDIQMGMLSTDFPRFRNKSPVDVYGFMEPAKEVSGDFYDFFHLNERTLLLVIGDVSGKGVPAALFMVMVKTLIRAIAKHESEPARILDALNPELCRDNDSAMFVTLFLAALDVATGRLSFSFGGHNPPLLLTRDGDAAFVLGDTGTALGVVEGFPFRQQSLVLAPGDGLLLYTDGITEAMSKDFEIFGEERLLAHVDGQTGKDAQELVEGVLGAVRAYAQGAEQSDDITLLALRLGPPGG